MHAGVEGVAGGAPGFQTVEVSVPERPEDHSGVDGVIAEGEAQLAAAVGDSRRQAGQLAKGEINFVLAEVKGAGEGMGGLGSLIGVLDSRDLKVQLALVGNQKVGVQAGGKGHRLS